MPDDSDAQRDYSESRPADLQQLSALLLEAEPAFVLDLRGRITEVNAAAQETYGMGRDELLGAAIQEAYSRPSGTIRSTTCCLVALLENQSETSRVQGRIRPAR